jgi:hypothetical protein
VLAIIAGCTTVNTVPNVDSVGAKAVEPDKLAVGEYYPTDSPHLCPKDFNDWPVVYGPDPIVTKDDKNGFVMILANPDPSSKIAEVCIIVAENYDLIIYAYEIGAELFIYTLDYDTERYVRKKIDKDGI